MRTTTIANEEQKQTGVNTDEPDTQPEAQPTSEYDSFIRMLAYDSSSAANAIRNPAH